MLRRNLFIITAAASALAGAALAHPGGGGGGGAGHGGGAAAAPGAAMGHFGGSSLGPGGGPGNFGANGQADNPLAGADFGRGRSGLSSRPAIAEDHAAKASGRDDVHPASVASTSTPKVLDNAKLDTALSKALAKSGVTLPAGGLKSACAGFGSLGQCVAALHVAQNLSVPGGFDALKAAATAPNASLGQAIQKLEPGADAKAALRTADRQADADLRETDRS